MEDDRWDDVVYSSQMAVEQSAKAVLRSIGIDFPRQHDVSDVFVGIANRSEIPSWFRDEVPEISDIVAKLSEQRALASYGFEQGIDVGYFKDFAPEALKEAREVYSRCKDVLDQLLNQ